MSVDEEGGRSRDPHQGVTCRGWEKQYHDKGWQSTGMYSTRKRHGSVTRGGDTKNLLVNDVPVSPSCSGHQSQYGGTDSSVRDAGTIDCRGIEPRRALVPSSHGFGMSLCTRAQISLPPTVVPIRGPPAPDLYSSQARSTRKQGGSILYERSDNCRGFIIQKSNPCFRVLLAWDEYSVSWRKIVERGGLVGRKSGKKKKSKVK